MQCGQFATCSVTPKGPQCTCNTGCSGNPHTGCVDVNECTANLPLDPNGPCGSGATCINVMGSYKCECPPGTRGDPMVGCEGGRAGGCQSDAECPQTAACDVKNGVCYDPCLTFQCGPNTSCEPEDHRATCWCTPGFEGNYPLQTSERIERTRLEQRKSATNIDPPGLATLEQIEFS